MAVDAKELMETFGISQLLVEHDGKYSGVVHLHDLIKVRNNYTGYMGLQIIYLVITSKFITPLAQLKK